MRRLIYTVLLGVFLGVSCESDHTISPDCSPKIDSVNSYWIEVVKALSVNLKDSVVIKDSVNYIDSLRIRDSVITSIRDSIIISFKDSVSIRDSISLRDSVVYVLWRSFQIPIKEVRADTFGGNLVVNNLIDDQLFYTRSQPGTRWGASGYPHQAMFYFDTTYVITEIWVNVFGWDEGFTHTIDIYSYGDKIETFTTSSSLWSKHQLLAVASHLYIEVTGGKNSWTDIAEIRLFGNLKID